MSNSHAPAGLLPLDKPAGWSSSRALARARRLLGSGKAGHAGTLDPFATGMLVCAFGRATRVHAWLGADDKRYEAMMQVGQATVTGDPEGEITATAPVPAIDLAGWQALAGQLTGAVEQVPPMYSALKHQGRRLYQLARAGHTVNRKPRRIQIHEFRIRRWEPPRLWFELHCSKGTYVRTLAGQLAERAGTVAHLLALRRTASGALTEAQLVTLEQLEAASDPRALLLPVDRALRHMPAIRLTACEAHRFRHGQRTKWPDHGIGAHAAAPVTCRVYDAGQRFLGLARRGPDASLKPIWVYVD